MPGDVPGGKGGPKADHGEGEGHQQKQEPPDKAEPGRRCGQLPVRDFRFPKGVPVGVDCGKCFFLKG